MKIRRSQFSLALVTVCLFSGFCAGAQISVRSGDFGARGNGTTDDTRAIQLVLNRSHVDGDVILIPRGKYLITETLELDGDKPWIITGEGFGSILIFRPSPALVAQHAASGEPLPAVRVRGKNNPAVLKQLRNLTIWGPKFNDGDHYGQPNVEAGQLVGLHLLNAHQGSIEHVILNGFDGAGLQINDAYGWEIRNLMARFNGYGVRCEGANATNFFNLECTRNLYGYQNIQSLVGARIEENWRSGAVYTDTHYHYSVHDGWFESNGNGQKNRVNRTREAHIKANSSEEWTDENFQPISLAISGNTTFATPFGNESHPQMNILAGCFNLSISGVTWQTARDQPRYHLHPKSRVIDCSIGQHLMEPGIGGGAAATGPFHYARPTWIDGFDASKDWWSTK